MGEHKHAAQPSQEFEKGSWPTVRRTVASFDAHDKTLLQKLQHSHHSSRRGAADRAGSVADRLRVILGGKFFSAFTMTLILQQWQSSASSAPLRHARILTAGIDLSVGAIMVLSSVIMGAVHFTATASAVLSVICGLGVGALCGYNQRNARRADEAAAFIVTLACGRSCSPPTSSIPPMRRSGLRIFPRMPRSCSSSGQNFRIGNAVFTYGVVVMVPPRLPLWLS